MAPVKLDARRRADAPPHQREAAPGESSMSQNWLVGLLVIAVVVLAAGNVASLVPGSPKSSLYSASHFFTRGE